MSKIRIIVVEDHPLFRQGVADTLSLEPDFFVVGEADTGPNALEVIRELKPDIALLDVNLPGMNGQQVTRQIQAERIPTKVIFLTAYDDLEQILHSMKAGAYAYCAKNVEPDHLIKVIRLVNQGNYVIGEQVMDEKNINQWMESVSDGSPRAYSDPGEPYHPLSKREMEVLMKITQGKSNKEIAGELGISHQTVKNHVTSILRKLNVDDRTQAAVYALKRGWVRLDDEFSSP
jgi:DNA-binding NarL/FixJ family response regulator